MFLEEKLDILIQKQKELIDMVEIFLPDLTTEKGVIHFLEITKNTFNTYIKEDILLEGKHFVKNANKKVFVPQEIIKLKKMGIKGKHKNSNKKQETLDFLNQKLGIIPRAGISEL